MATAKSTNAIGQGQLDICGFAGARFEEFPTKSKVSALYPLKVVELRHHGHFGNPESRESSDAECLRGAVGTGCPTDWLSRSGQSGD